MAEWLSRNGEVPDMILSSPLKRASQTAEMLGSAFNLGIAYDNDLMEFNNGQLQGLPFAEAETRFPIHPEHKRTYISYYGQETLLDFRARAEKALSRILDVHGERKKIAIVSHGGMINMLFRSFMRMPMTMEYAISSGDTAVHKWEVHGTKRQLVFLNSMEHLHSSEFYGE